MAITDIQRRVLDPIFRYRKPSLSETKAKVYIDELVGELAEAIVDMSKPNMAQAVSLKRLRECRFWVHEAIMDNGG